MIQVSLVFGCLAAIQRRREPNCGCLPQGPNGFVACGASTVTIRWRHIGVCRGRALSHAAQKGCYLLLLNQMEQSFDETNSFGACDWRRWERTGGSERTGAGRYYRNQPIGRLQSGRPYLYHRQAIGRRYPDSRGNRGEMLANPC